jgi:predicted MFS family arabinose efflux permease
VAGGVLYGLAKTAVFVVDGATCGAVAVLLWFALPRLHGGDRSASLGETVGDWLRAVTHPIILWLAVLNVGFAVAYAQMQSTVPVFAESALGLSSEQLGTLYVLNPLVIVLFQMPVVACARRWRRTRGLMFSTGFWAASFVAVIFAHWTPRLFGIALVGAFLVLRTVGELLHSPIVTTLACDVSGSEARGSQLSVVEVTKRLGFGAGSVVGGAFFDAGMEGLLLWPALVGMCGVLALGALVLETRVSPSANERAVAEN